MKCNALVDVASVLLFNLNVHTMLLLISHLFCIHRYSVVVLHNVSCHVQYLCNGRTERGRYLSSSEFGILKKRYKKDTVNVKMEEF